MRTIIQCGKLFTAVDEAVRERMAVIVEGEKITAVQPVGETDLTGAAIIDLSDKFVMPGLIDAHVHVNMDGKEHPSVLFSTKTAGELTILSILNAQEDLMAGFTTIRDEGGAQFTDIAVKEAIDAGKIVGPRMMASGMPLTATGGHADYRFGPNMEGRTLGIVGNGPDAIRAAVRLNLKYGADQIKIMATGGVMSFGNDPRCSEFTLEEMRAATEIAEMRGKITSAHAHGSDGIKTAVRAGITSIEHGMLMDDECVELMAERGTYLVPTIIAAKSIADGAAKGLPAWMVEKSAQVVKGHRENCRKCREAGIPIGFGSDAGTSFNLHGKQTLEFELMHDFGFAPVEVLTAATRTNASLMRWDDRIGTLEAGKLADVAAFDESPLENLKTLHSVSFVMKGGAVIKRDGRCTVSLHP